jgi:hypothetical protein
MSEIPAPSAAGSRWEDLLDVFIAPGELFRRRSDGKFGFGLLMLVVLTAIIFFGTRSAMQPIWDAEFQRGIAANPNLTPEQMETGRKFAAGLAPVFVVVGLPIGVLLLGLVIWLAARTVGGKPSYAQGATIATFAFYPRLLQGVVGAAQALLMDEGKLTSQYSVSLGVARFLDPQSTSAMLLAFLGRVDLFTLWVTVLVAVGLKQMTRITTGQAAAGAALVWLLGSLPALLQGLRAA